MTDEVARALETIFAADSELYRDRGFMRRVGYGTRPALVNIDLANAWTRPGNPFSCTGMDVIVPGVQRLLAAARAKRIPVAFTTTAYSVTDGPDTEMGLWHRKIPVEVLRLGTDAVAIDERLAPEAGEHVIVKPFASAFHRTRLEGLLRAAAIDTVIVTGVTMAGCVRHTVEDALGLGFRPIVVRECVGDRVAGAVEWNLFDIDAKFGDVESLADVLEYLGGIELFTAAATTAGSAPG
jgi:maleamate amidohydrolase